MGLEGEFAFAGIIALAADGDGDGAFAGEIGGGFNAAGEGAAGDAAEGAGDALGDEAFCVIECHAGGDAGFRLRHL